MAFLLDTNMVSELRRPRPHGGVVAWIQSVDDAKLYLGSVTIGEIQARIELTRDQDSAKADAIERWLDQVCNTFNIFTMDGPALRRRDDRRHRQGASAQGGDTQCGRLQPL
jgi:predicted nucleic acid-binding protein